MLFDMQSFNFIYKFLSKGKFVEKKKKQTTNVVWNLAPEELNCEVQKKILPKICHPVKNFNP